MAQAKGSLSQLIMFDESTFGTKATGNGLRLPHVSYAVALSQELATSQVLQGNRNPTIPFLDQKNVAGQIRIQPDVRSIPHILRHAIGTAVTTGAGPSYTHTFKPTALPIGITFEAWFSDVSIALHHLGCRIGGFSFEAGPGGALIMSLDIIGADEDDGAGGQIDAAPCLYSAVPLKLGSMTLTQGGSALLKATRFALNFSNNLDEQAGRTIGSAGKITSLPEGLAIASGSLAVQFESMTQFNKAKNETEDSMIVSFPSATAAGHKLEFEMAEIRYKVTSPPIEGPGGISCTMDWTSYYDDHANAAGIVARVVNDISSVATIPS